LFYQTVEPTPRPDRISRDYSQECPDVQVEARKVISQFPEKSKNNMENVKLQDEASKIEIYIIIVVSFR